MRIQGRPPTNLPPPLALEHESSVGLVRQILQGKLQEAGFALPRHIVALKLQTKHDATSRPAARTGGLNY